jgi:hypothetical protein
MKAKHKTATNSTEQYLLIKKYTSAVKYLVIPIDINMVSPYNI